MPFCGMLTKHLFLSSSPAKGVVTHASRQAHFRVGTSSFRVVSSTPSSDQNISQAFSQNAALAFFFIAVQCRTGVKGGVTYLPQQDDSFVYDALVSNVQCHGLEQVCTSTCGFPYSFESRSMLKHESASQGDDVHISC